MEACNLKSRAVAEQLSRRQLSARRLVLPEGSGNQALCVRASGGAGVVGDGSGLQQINLISEMAEKEVPERKRDAKAKDRLLPG